MPGTIQVSILELVGLPSVSRSSSMGIKVTVGKQALEAQDRGDFSFPLASLRDSVNVSIRDHEGNEIAHTAVETRSIVEKGIWDDLFALKGGGHVRMRLHFVLTEDEMDRIRSMRESATRRKREDLLKRRYSSSDLAIIASGGSRASSQDSLKATHQAEKLQANPADNEVKKIAVVSDANILSKSHPSRKRQVTPVVTTSKSTGALDRLQVNRQIKGVIQSRDQEKQSPMDKTLSNEGLPDPPPVSKTRVVPQISSSATVEAPARLPRLKKTIGAHAKPAPIPEGTGKEIGESQGYGRSIYEEKFVQKPEKLKDLKLQNIDDMSSKKDLPKMQPTIEEQKEENNDLKPRNINHMSNKKDIPEIQPTREDKEEEKKVFKTQNIDYRLSNKEEEREEKKVLKDTSKMQPTREDQKEEKKDFKPQNMGSMPNEEDIPKMQATRDEGKKDDMDLKLQNIDYMSSKKDTPKMQSYKEEPREENKDLKDISNMQPTREERKEEEDLRLQNIDYMSSKKDIPKMQPIREEQKQEKIDLRSRSIDYIPSKVDITKTQPTREEQQQEKKAPKQLRLSSNAESSRSPWGGLVQAFPTRKQSSTIIPAQQRGSPLHDTLIVEKNWRSKHWTSLQYRVKPNMTSGNVNYSSDRLHDWIFLNEMICSCIPSDCRPFIDLTEGCLSNCSQDTNQGKLVDTGVATKKDGKGHVQSKKLDSGSSSNDGDSGRPIGQAMKIAIMVGFGILVFLTRQRR